MKMYYEDRTRVLLPRRTYTIIRIDGKAFHTYTRGLQRPFDDHLITDMDETAMFLCKNIQGAKFAFVQSDEISVLLTDFEEIGTTAWFDGGIQKIVSVSASMATAKFNELRPGKLAFFDSRVFTIPSKIEVENYFIWRQQDTIRNSISAVAQSLYSTKELNKKNTSEQQEMIFQKGINWNDLAPKYKRGRFIEKQEYDKDGAVRTKWVSIEPVIFSQYRFFLDTRIPDMDKGSEKASFDIKDSPEWELLTEEKTPSENSFIEVRSNSGYKVPGVLKFMNKRVYYIKYGKIVSWLTWAEVTKFYKAWRYDNKNNGDEKEYLV